MGEKTAGRREGWGCRGSARDKCHSEPGEGRVRAQGSPGGGSLLQQLRAPHSSLTPPALGVPARSPGSPLPGSPKVGSGIAETQSRRRLYLRRRLEALQPELRPPPAPRLEWDGGAAGPVPSRFPFPRRGPVAAGFLRRGPHPSAPPSASQRLALDAAIFHQASER
ncbi:uncharacterized protein LOC110328219 [Mus pahari]|uniref:uncharacterized protein LOC110328219 n=1 Tax=Mus pahari TaxID=10093 RepID=UPI000A311709|nr:uncharacterized protein LOC110328219 [Mus pahari]